MMCDWKNTFKNGTSPRWILYEPCEVVSFWQRWLGPQHPADRIFDGADLDRDGHLDRRELAQYMMKLSSIL